MTTLTPEQRQRQDDLSAQKDALVLRKRELEGRLLNIKNLIRSSGRMTTDKYRQCCDSQAQHIRDVLALDAKITEIRQELRKLATLDTAQMLAVTSNGHEDRQEEQFLIVRELVALRQHYREFAADPTRVSSMRTMAAEFAMKLDPIIKRTVNGG